MVALLAGASPPTIHARKYTMIGPTFEFFDTVFSVWVSNTVAPHLVHSELWEQPVTLARVTIEADGVH